MKILLNARQKMLLNNFVIEFNDSPLEMAKNPYIIVAIESLGTTIRNYYIDIGNYCYLAKAYRRRLDGFPIDDDQKQSLNLYQNELLLDDYGDDLKL